MKKNTIRLGAAALAVVATTAIVAGISSAHTGGFKIFNSEKHQALKTALDNRDYTAFADVLGNDHPKLDKITEENFDRFADAKELKAAGDYEGAKAIYTELGFDKGFGHKLHGFYSKEKHAAMKAAIENNDYEAWLAAVGEDSYKADGVMAENFGTFVEMHKLFEAGDIEGATALSEKLGFDSHFKGFRHFQKWDGTK